MTDPVEDLTLDDLLEIVAAYIETGFKALDKNDLAMARAAFRRISQYMLDIHGKGGHVSEFIHPKQQTGLEKLAGMLERRLDNTWPFVYEGGVTDNSVTVDEGTVAIWLMYGGGQGMQFQMTKAAAARLRDRLDETLAEQ